MLRTILACLLLALTASVFAQAPVAPSGLVVSTNPLSLSVAGLHVSGNRILNNLGQAVQLRGVNKAGTEYMCINGQIFDGPADASTVALFKSLGINVVRLPHNSKCWLGIDGHPGGGLSAAAYQTAIVNFVNLLTAANIAVIVDLQWSAPGTGPANSLIPMPDADHAPAFWTSAANVYKGNDKVILDPWNEPWPDNNSNSQAAWDCIKNGGTCPGLPYQAASMPSLITAIRNTGATNIIIVGGPGFSYYVDQWATTYAGTDPLNQLGVSFHYYPPQIYDNAHWDSLLSNVMQSYPFVQGEIGENDCQHQNIDPLMVYLDSHGGHYLGWAFNTYDCNSFPSLITAYDGTPTSFGAGFFSHLAEVTGKPIPAQPVIPFFCSSYPCGIAVGSATNYTAVDGTTYFGDVNNTNPGLTTSFQFFTPYATGNSIAGTSDPALYQKGRVGAGGTFRINMPNGNYTLTLGMAPNTSFTQTTVDNPSTASVNNAGEYGQDQIIQANKVGTCVWSSFPFNPSPYSSPFNLACPQIANPVPVANQVSTVSYTFDVANQVAALDIGAAFGGGRKTVLSAVKIVQNSVATKPAVPVGFVATAGNGVVNLSWNATSGVTNYKVKRGLAARGFFQTIALPTGTTYSDPWVSNGKTYYYLLASQSSAGSSAYASVVSATPVLSAPIGVNGSPGNTQAVLGWSAVANATGYKVKRATTSGGPYTQVGAPTSPTFTNTGLTNGTTYFYVITATNGSFESGNSSQASVTPSAGGGGTGVWTNVTPGGVNLTPGAGSCNSFGIETVYFDASNPGVGYFMIHCGGVWKTTNYGLTWTGPINTGTNGASITDCAGGISLQPNATAGQPPTIYVSCIRGSLGFWKSVDGGVSWTNYSVPLGPSGFQDWYPAVIDPYLPSHLIMAGHEQNYIIQSFNGGQTWASVSMNAGMNQAGGTAFLNFINTGNSGTTATTWLYTAQETGGNIGTWRTTNSGSTWTKVDNAEHAHGAFQIYQPDTSGVVFMAGTYSVLGNGVLRSTDYGQTWTHVGLTDNSARNVVWGTPTKIYATYGWPAGNFNISDQLERANVPGTGTWTAPGGAICTSPAGLSQGPSRVAVVNDGVHNIFLAASFNAGICRYVEP